MSNFETAATCAALAFSVVATYVAVTARSAEKDLRKRTAVATPVPELRPVLRGVQDILGDVVAFQGLPSSTLLTGLQEARVVQVLEEWDTAINDPQLRELVAGVRADLKEMWALAMPSYEGDLAKYGKEQVQVARRAQDRTEKALKRCAELQSFT